MAVARRLRAVRARRRHRGALRRRRVRHPAGRHRRGGRRRRASPSAILAGAAPRRSTLSGTRCSPRPASGSRSAPPATSAPRTCCATPTWRCTAPRRGAGRATRSFDRAHARAGARRGCSWRPTCAGRCERGELALHYQPIVRLRDAGASPASRRWCAGSTRSAACVAPDDFIPVAEETGLIVPIGRLGAARGLPRSCAEWQRGYPGAATLAAEREPLRARSSAQADLVDEVRDALRGRPGSPPRRAAAGDHRERDDGERRAAAEPMLRRLRALGVRL